MIEQFKAGLMNKVLEVLGSPNDGMITSITLHIDFDSLPQLRIERLVINDESSTRFCNQGRQDYIIRLEPVTKSSEASEVENDES